MSSVETMKGWAKKVKDQNDMPGDFSQYYQSKFQGFSEDIYVVYIPKYNSKVAARPKLVVLKDGYLYIAERTASGIMEKSCRLEDVFFLEKKTVLLDSRLHFKALAREGCLEVKIEYNSVGDELFDVIIRSIRAAGSVAEMPGSPEPIDMDYLIDTDIKFFNYFRMSFDTQDMLLAHIYQPEIRDERRWVFPRLISPTQLLALSGREIISIREEGSKRRRKRDYGGIWTFIPRGHVKKLELDDNDSGLLSLKMKLPYGNETELLFSPEKRSEVLEYLKRFEAIRK